jgi:hypothetical protein
MDVGNTGEENTNDANEEDLVDYNDEEVAASEEKAAKKLVLREMLSQNGFAIRTILRIEHVKAH